MVEELSINLESKFVLLSIDFPSHLCNAKCNANFTLYNERLGKI